MAFTLTKNSKGPKKPKAETLDPGALVQLSTSFDYLNGAFGRAEKGRQTTAVIAISGLALSAGLGFLGLQGKSAARDDLAATETAQTDNTSTLSELAQLDQAGGIPADILRTQTQARFGAYKSIVTGEIDLQGLLRAATTSAPAGVTVSAVSVVEPEPVPADGAVPPADGTAPPVAPPAEGVPAEGVPAPEVKKTVTLTGLATSFAKIGEWQSGLARIPGLSGVEPSWTGGGSELTVTITATLEKGAWSKRALDSEAADGNGLPRPNVPTEGQ